MRSENEPDLRSNSINRDWSLAASGSWAINSGGRSYSKSSRRKGPALASVDSGKLEFVRGLDSDMDLKDFIGETSASLGFQRAVVAGLTPMEAERQEFAEWLSRGYAAGMDYLKRNPHFR